MLVTDATHQAMQVRFLMSAHSSVMAWELRCYVREHLVAFIQREYPQFLPRLRAQLEQGVP